MYFLGSHCVKLWWIYTIGSYSKENFVWGFNIVENTNFTSKICIVVKENFENVKLGSLLHKVFDSNCVQKVGMIIRSISTRNFKTNKNENDLVRNKLVAVETEKCWTGFVSKLRFHFVFVLGRYGNVVMGIQLV